MSIRWCSLFAVIFGLTDCWAEPLTKNLDLSGYAGLDIRGFTEDSSLPGQRNKSIYPSVVLKPEFQFEWNDGNDRLKFTPYLRLDAFDENRRYFDIREALWLHRYDNWDLRLGIGEVFWGVAESRHLVNIINQVDTIEDIDEEDRLGQPMINLNWFSSQSGTFEFYVLPGFRERRFVDRKGRLRLDTIPIDPDSAVYESSWEDVHVDAAFRWNQVVGEWDIGISQFYGTSREARFEARPNSLGPPTELVPHYDIINQTGVDIQWTHGSWLWKLEAFRRGGHDRTFQAIVGGLEYSFYGILGTDIDLGLLAEYLWDDRSSQAPLTPFDDDIFSGLRFAFNDEKNTEILIGAIIDRNTGASLINLEASRRLFDSWKLSLDSRIFVNITEKDRALFAMRKDSFVNLQLAYYF